MYTWQKDLCPSSDSRPEGILDLVHSEEAQELEEEVMMSPTVYDNLKSNGTATARLQVCISGLIFLYCCILSKCCNWDNSL
jgi:hypothetical protein